jgi:predicted nucleic acid-binding Zn ribbon protein
MLPPLPKRIPPLGPGKTTPRQRVRAQWYGADLQPLEKAQKVTARSSHDLMAKVLKELRLDRRRTEAEVVKVWNSALEPDIVSHAQPTGLRKGTLFVAVDSNVWLSEIVRFRRKEILERLQGSFGRDLIAKISFRLG